MENNNNSLLTSYKKAAQENRKNYELSHHALR